jgi:hypothetical protein
LGAGGTGLTAFDFFAALKWIAGRPLYGVEIERGAERVTASLPRVWW